MLTASSVKTDVDSRGPIVQVGRARPSVRAGRVEVKEFRYDPVQIPSRPGKAKWMWLGGNSTEEPPVVALFRRELKLLTKPVSALLWFSADAHARIYVNGHLAARGPDDGGQDYPGIQTGRWFVNYSDLTPYFRKGTNVLAAEVFTAEAMQGRYNTTGHGGFLLECALKFSNSTTMHLEADSEWKSREGAEWKFENWKPVANAKPERVLQFDANQECAGWRLPGFDDSHWNSCAPVTTAWPPLVQSEIPERMEATYPWHEVLRATPSVSRSGSSLRFDRDGSCAIRFDRVLSGFIGLKIRGKAGTFLSIQPNELNEPGYHRTATVRLRDGEQVLELPFYDSFSVINLVATQVTGPMEVLDIRANFVAQPVTYRGSFSCSDPNLSRMWELSRWLTEMCQQTHHLDSPHHQEPICDPGDYLIISLNNYCAFGQPWLARQDLRKYAWLLHATQYRPFHTSYALLWLQMLMKYEDYTGDSTLLHELGPTAHELLDKFSTYLGKNGLISEAPDYMFMDWVTIGGFGAHHPPAVIGQGYMTAFYYQGLADGIRLARMMGDNMRAKKYEKQRDEIKRAFNRELWDGEKGLYRDGRPFETSVKPADWLPADKAIETHSTQNNVLAVLYDLAPIQHQVPIMRRLIAGEMNTQPYFMHFVLDAIDHTGLFDEFGTAQMRRWKIEPDTQSFREMWGTGDFSHAWQCTPMYQMSARVLGITPSSPGFSTILIRPQTCDLAWAKGSVPTPHGNVKVSWRKTPRTLVLEATIPFQLMAIVNVQTDARSGTLMLDGSSVPYGKVQLSPGNHRLVLNYGSPPETAQGLRPIHTHAGRIQNSKFRA